MRINKQMMNDDNDNDIAMNNILIIITDWCKWKWLLTFNTTIVF